MLSNTWKMLILQGLIWNAVCIVGDLNLVRQDAQKNSKNDQVDGMCFASGSWKSLTFLGQQKTDKISSWKSTGGKITKKEEEYEKL